MKTLFATIAIIVLSCATVAQAQVAVPPIEPPPDMETGDPGLFLDGGYGGRYGYHASTLHEGIARGVADIIRSGGEASRSMSEAAVNLAEARRMELENALNSVDVLYEGRRKLREYRAAERKPRPTLDDLARYAESARPDRLDSIHLDTASGELSWPALLREEAFSKHRDELQGVFSRRAEVGHMTAEDYSSLKQVTGAMKAELKGRLHQYPLTEYASTKRFIRSLTYEAQLPIAPIPGIAGQMRGLR
ncbi:MAG: hypothetical protein ACYTG0_11310 [Planctomycetota bacterium]|jgi:hypothetical protein